MTTALTLYQNLIAAQHSTKPNYLATIAASVQPFVDLQNSESGFSQDFDLDTATGAQLDAIGVRVGISRNVSTPITGVYFSLDVAGLGLDQGWLQGQFDPTTGLTALDDITFRLLIRAKILANQWNGTVSGANAILNQIFSQYTFFICDNLDMTMTVGLSGNLPNIVLQSLFTGGYLLIRPAGVGIRYVVTPVPGSPIFGLDVENRYISGLDVGAIV